MRRVVERTIPQNRVQSVHRVVRPVEPIRRHCRKDPGIRMTRLHIKSGLRVPVHIGPPAEPTGDGGGMGIGLRGDIAGPGSLAERGIGFAVFFLV